MSTAVAKKQASNGLPVLPVLPNYSPRLRKLMEQLSGRFTYDNNQLWRNGSGDCKHQGFVYVRDPAALEGLEEVKAEALKAYKLCQLALEPTTPAIVLNWLRPIAAGVRNSPDETDFAAKAAAIAMACDGLPVHVFNVTTQKLALQEFKFWPSAADVYELLSEMGENSIWGYEMNDLLSVINIRGTVAELEKGLADAERQRRDAERRRREADQKRWDEERAKRAAAEQERQERERARREEAEQKQLEAALNRWREEIEESAEQYLREYKQKQREEQKREAAAGTTGSEETA